MSFAFGIVYFYRGGNGSMGTLTWIFDSSNASMLY